MNYKQVLNQIQLDERYQENLDWGKPRDGHPEGSIRAHIAELESNLGLLESKLTEEEIDRLRVLIHTHDTFKPNAERGVAISDPRSHASLAKSFLSEFTDDESLLIITQFHDEPFALWKKHFYGGDPKTRLHQLLDVLFVGSGKRSYITTVSPITPPRNGTIQFFTRFLIVAVSIAVPSPNT